MGNRDDLFLKGLRLIAELMGSEETQGDNVDVGAGVQEDRRAERRVLGPIRTGATYQRFDPHDTAAGVRITRLQGLASESMTDKVTRRGRASRRGRARGATGLRDRRRESLYALVQV